MKKLHPLTAYRLSQKLLLRDFGALIGANESMVWKWERGVAIPRRKYQLKIHKVTKGAVTPNDFVLPSGGASRA